MPIKFEYSTSLQPFEKVVKKQVAEELLESLQSIIECLDKGVPLDEQNCGYEFDNARKAIAKALGE